MEEISVEEFENIAGFIKPEIWFPKVMAEIFGEKRSTGRANWEEKAQGSKGIKT